MRERERVGAKELGEVACELPGNTAIFVFPPSLQRASGVFHHPSLPAIDLLGVNTSGAYSHPGEAG